MATRLVYNHPNGAQEPVYLNGIGQFKPGVPIEVHPRIYNHLLGLNKDAKGNRIGPAPAQGFSDPDLGEASPSRKPENEQEQKIADLQDLVAVLQKKLQEHEPPTPAEEEPAEEHPAQEQHSQEGEHE